METRNTCYAHGDKARAVVALVSPFLLILWGCFVLIQKGYRIFEYFNLVIDGELSWVRQGLGWAALVIWVLRYWPSAYAILTGNPCLINSNGRFIYLGYNKEIPINDITSVNIRNRLFSKTLVFIGNGFVLDSQSILMTREKSRDIVRSVSKLTSSDRLD